LQPTYKLSNGFGDLLYLFEFGASVMSEVDETESLKILVELWKQAVDVQKHLKDIEMRVRSLALTVLTFALGAAAIATKDNTTARILGYDVHLSGALLSVGLVIWMLYYFVDQIWYHRLLVGAVEKGMDLEAKIAKCIPAPALTKAIGKSSPYPLNIGIGRWRVKREIHSAMRLRVLYWLVAAILLLLAVGLQTASTSQGATSNSTHRHPARVRAQR
jgi:hypothetical protein